MRKTEKKRFINALVFAAAVIIIYGVITNLRFVGSMATKAVAIFAPLFIGIFFALILYKPMTAIYKLFLKLKAKSKAKRKLSDTALRNISLTITLVLALVIIYFVGNSVVPQIVLSFKSIFESMDTYYPKALEYIRNLGFDTTEIENLIAEIDFASIWKQIWKTVTDNANEILDTAVGAISGIAMVITSLVSATIFSIYLLANSENLKRQIGKVLDAYLKPELAARIKRIGMLIIRTFLNFFSGQCLEAVILGTLFFIAMNIFGFPYATVVSVITGFTAMIPYVGAFIGCAVGAVLIFMQSPMRALLFIVMFLIIQQLENNLIYPRVVGTAVNLPAMWTFTAIIIGGSVGGVVGMIIFIPITSVLYTLLKNDVNYRLEKKKQEEEEQHPPV